MQAKAQRRPAQRRSLLVLRHVLEGCSQPTFEPREAPWRLHRPGSSYGRLLHQDLLDEEVVGDALRDVRAASLRGSARPLCGSVQGAAFGVERLPLYLRGGEAPLAGAQ